MAIDVARTRELLHEFDFGRLFIEELGWSNPPAPQPTEMQTDGFQGERRQIAELSGVLVFEVSSKDGFPDAKTRAAIQKAIAQSYHENLIIFVDSKRTQSLWYWVKRENGKLYPREHLFVKGQPGDLFISKISGMVFDISRFEDQDKIPIVQVSDTLKKALDVERVTKKFYAEFADERLTFIELIQGIDDPKDRRWYASVLLNRLMYIYFLQRTSLLDNGNTDYLRQKMHDVEQRYGKDCYYENFLKLLFFEGFAKPKPDRSPEARELLGEIVYLNGGLFLRHRIELENPNIRIPDKAFAHLFTLFERYSWNLDDTPGGKDDEINPDVLGYIFEKYINQKAFGAYYTRPEITEYLCEHTIHQVILDKINPKSSVPGVPTPKSYDSLPDLLLYLDADTCKRLLFEVLPSLAILDPACGSGAFLVAAMKTLINIYSAVTGRIEYLGDRNLSEWLKQTRDEHASLNYYIKRTIITDNLFGVDIMEEACEIAKLRLFLALVSSAQSVRQLEPLPNIDFNIVSGSSLIGLLRVDDEDFNRRHSQGSLFRKSYRDVLAEKNRLIGIYRHAATYNEDLQGIRDKIEESRQEAAEVLDDILLDEFSKLGVKYEEATWDEKRDCEGKPKKRAIIIDDIRALKPFHWGYEFDEVLNARGGFDVIITNPPWEIVKPQAKEFFADYSDLVTVNKMTIKEFQVQQAELLGRKDIRVAWLDYQSRFPHVSAYYRLSKQYQNQVAKVDGRKAGADINLYKLFLEQCFNLLRGHGQCGIVIPSGIYTDLGAKQLREMLFAQTRITGFFGFENRRTVFEGVDGRFKFVVLTFQKGSSTSTFPAAFMRHDVAELSSFPRRGSLPISVDLLRRLSPDSLSIFEFKCETDVLIAEKMLRYPLLGEHMDNRWNLSLTREFDMTIDSYLFHTTPASGRLPLFEGKMMHQFTIGLAPPRYWINEPEGRSAVLGRRNAPDIVADYQDYRLAFRRIGRNTDERSMIATVLPRNVFAAESFNLSSGRLLAPDELLYLTAVLNSFALDFCLRQRISANINMFYVYQLPVPRLTAADSQFAPLVTRAARLVCTTSEFDDLAVGAGAEGYQCGATDLAERVRLRAELDALVAHLYGLTLDEFSYVLSTFPIVSTLLKESAMQAYRDVEKGRVM